MENKWHEIWEKRSAKLAGIDRTDYQAVFAELKRINGFDITGGGIPLNALIEQYEDTKKKINVLRGGDTLRSWLRLRSKSVHVPA